MSNFDTQEHRRCAVNAGLVIAFVCAMLYMAMLIKMGWSAENALIKTKKQLEEERAMLMVRQNLTRVNEGIYMLVSIDGGQNWAEFEKLPTGEYTLVGPASAEVVSRMDASPMLKQYAEQNGPFTPNHTVDANTLMRAGITFLQS